MALSQMKSVSGSEQIATKSGFLSQTNDQDRMNSEFLNELKDVYHNIDKFSNLMWCHKDETQLIQRRDNKQKTRSRITNEVRQETNKWEKETDAQLGYGEITKGALMNLLTVIQNAKDLFSDDIKKKLPFPLDEYNLNHKSTFLDIGSGFGKPVFHASMQTYCISKGIEVVPARVAFCVDQQFQILENQQKKNNKAKTKEQKNNASNKDSLCPEEKIPELKEQDRKFSQDLEESSLIETNDLNKIVDSTYSSSILCNIDPPIIPFGDILSVLTGSLASVRNLQVSIPLLKDQQILSPEPTMLPNLDLLKKMIDDKLDNFQFRRGLLVEPVAPNNMRRQQSIDEETKGSNSKRDKKFQEKKQEVINKQMQKISIQTIPDTPSEQQQENSQLQQNESSQKRKRGGQDNIRADFRHDWCNRVSFEVCDAAKGPEKYIDDDGKDYTHIYSYNKVMSHKDRKGISKILNRTNYRILAWYFGPDKTRQSGLKNFELIYQSPMQSTGGEKFTCYVYYRTKKYNDGDPISDSEDDIEEKEDADGKIEKEESQDDGSEGEDEKQKNDSGKKQQERKNSASAKGSSSAKSKDNKQQSSKKANGSKKK